MPDVNPLMELMDMREGEHSYQANSMPPAL
jgi:flagellar basal body rod protein FlgC